MTSLAALPQAPISTPSPSIATAPALAKGARAADGDYKAKGLGHEVKDADGDYKPMNAATSAAASTASPTLLAVTSMQRGG